MGARTNQAPNRRQSRRHGLNATMPTILPGITGLVGAGRLGGWTLTKSHLTSGQICRTSAGTTRRFASKAPSKRFRKFVMGSSWTYLAISGISSGCDIWPSSNLAPDYKFVKAGHAKLLPDNLDAAVLDVSSDTWTSSLMMPGV